jgi:primase-polymerase (primpol)-like protein
MAETWRGGAPTKEHHVENLPPNLARPERPTALPVQPENIPQELRERPQWVLWRYRWREGKDGQAGRWCKPPFNARTGRAADATKPSTWSSFAKAWAAYNANRDRWDGIGYCFSKDDPYCGTH